MAQFDEKGREILDPTPVAIPVAFSRPPSIAEQVQRLVRSHLNAIAAEQGKESFEEADDFDVGDDDFPRSPHELSQDQDLEPPFTRGRLEQEFMQFLQQRSLKTKQETPPAQSAPAAESGSKGGSAVG